MSVLFWCITRYLDNATRMVLIYAYLAITPVIQ